MNFEQLRKLQAQADLAAKESAERSSDPPECDGGLSAILPGRDEDLSSRIFRLAEASYFCSKLRNSLTEMLNEECQSLEDTLGELLAVGSTSTEEASIDETIAEGMKTLLDGIESLFHILEDGDEEGYRNSMDAVREGLETIEKGSQEMADLDSGKE